MVLDVTAYGKAGHAARNDGVNAIYKVLEDIQWFLSLIHIYNPHKLPVH